MRNSKLSRDMTPEEACRALAVALGFAEHLSSMAQLNRGYKEPARKLEAYMPLALDALTIVKAYIDEGEEMPYRSNDRLLSHTLTFEQVKELIGLHKKGWTYQKLADKFEVHRNTVANILDRAKKRGLY